MAWTYLAESVESALPWLPGLGQSPTVKTIDTLKACSCLGCALATLPELQFGMMCAACGGAISEASTSSMEASHARTLALQELARAWLDSDPGCSLKSSGSLASFDPVSFSWKTSQLSLFGGLTEFFWSSLRWGMIADGQLYQPRRWEPRTFESGGSYLPTPVTVDAGSYFNKSKSAGAALRPTLGAMARHNLWPSPKTAAKTWPTPRAADGAKGLRTEAGAKKEQARGHGVDLTSAVKLSGAAGGQLNPTWVEWLMGYPVGWTESKGWATPSSPRKRAKPSCDSAD